MCDAWAPAARRAKGRRKPHAHLENRTILRQLPAVLKIPSRVRSVRGFVADLSLVESHFEADPSGLSAELVPSITFRNHAIGVPQVDGLVVVGVEAVVLVSAGPQTEGNLPLSCRYVIGCTVASPASEDGHSIESQLVEYAVATNEGYAQHLSSSRVWHHSCPSPSLFRR